MSSIFYRSYKVLMTAGVVYYMKRAFWWSGYFIRVIFAIITLRYFTVKKDLNELADFVFEAYGGLMRPLQDKEEIRKFTRIARDVSPRVIMEIGTASGGTLFMLCRASSKEAVIISADLPYGKFGGGYPAFKAPLYKKFISYSQDLRLLRGDSHSDKILNKVKKILSGRPIDLLFIDGDHTYEGVKQDFLMYSALVKRGGVIALHDIAAHPAGSGCQVDRFWNEIKNSYKHDEIIGHSGQKAFGIGVIYV